VDRLAQEGSARVLRSSFLFSISPTLVHFLQSFSALLSLTMPFTVVYILLALQMSFFHWWLHSVVFAGYVTVILFCINLHFLYNPIIKIPVL